MSAVPPPMVTIQPRLSEEATWFRLVRPDGTNAVAAALPDTQVKARYDANLSSLLVRLDGLTGKDSIAILDDAIRQLGTVKSGDWRNGTRGDAGNVAELLALVADREPDATWELVAKVPRVR